MTTQEATTTIMETRKVANSTGHLSLQERARQASISQKKWLMTSGPQNVCLDVRKARSEMARKPPSQELSASRAEMTLFMRELYLKG